VAGTGEDARVRHEMIRKIDVPFIMSAKYQALLRKREEEAPLGQMHRI
jgi:hypothetical protein